LLDRLKQIAGRAAAAGIGLTIDAEASESLSLQLDLFEAWRPIQRWTAGEAGPLRCRPISCARWNGGRVAGDRWSPPQARRHADRRAAGEGRLLDAEVKRAQELGLERYPVFTDKRLTDLSYLACARRLSSGLDSVYPQFATHNPVTLACVLVLADQLGGASAAAARFECQRLTGWDGRCTARSQLCIRICRCARMPRSARSANCLPTSCAGLLENSASTSYVRRRRARNDPAICCARVFDFLDADLCPRDLPSSNGAAHAATTHCKGL